MNGSQTILLTNDDGFHAPGIRMLYDALGPHYRVVIVAPDREQSGVGHAFTHNKPLHYEQAAPGSGMEGYVVSGTPADCVKFAVSYLLPQHPDAVVSGLNIGENSGLSAFYSGTVAAAREGAFWNIPSVAFSVCSESAPYAAQYAAMAPALLAQIIESDKRAPQTPGRIFYNVNFPTCAPADMRGVRITWQSMAFFDDRYERIEVESHKTKEGFMIYGEKKDIERSSAYDSRALMDNIITITPLSFDATAHAAIPHLQWMERAGGHDAEVDRK